MSKNKIITIATIRESLYDANLDTEYREALAHSMILLGFIDEDPINLYFGSQKEKEELERVDTTPLNSNQVSEIIHLMMYEMRNDFQYGRFKPVANQYIKISKNMRKEESKNKIQKDNKQDRKPKCNVKGIRHNV